MLATAHPAFRSARPTASRAFGAAPPAFPPLLEPEPAGAGNSVRYTCEFLSSFFFVPASRAFGTGGVLLFHATVALGCMVGLAVVLPETNPRFWKGGGALL